MTKPGLKKVRLIVALTSAHRLNEQPIFCKFHSANNSNLLQNYCRTEILFNDYQIFKFITVV